MSALAVERTELAPDEARLLPARPYGPRPAVERRALLRAVEAAGLTGRGGAGFPTARKLRAVAGRRSPVVVANGVEGEPASAKDKALLARNPHLVIDGVLAAAELIRARRATIAIARSDAEGCAAVTAALGHRRHEARAIDVALVPDRFVAGEETALVSALNGRDAKPTFGSRPFERGILVQNVETLANLALIARFGADWFRALGTPDEPGTALYTVSGAVRTPGVVEAPFGTPLAEIVRRCGGLTARPQAVLTGGYFGMWRTASALEAPADDGARTIVILPESACGVVETARAARYLASESARQCGPCLFGLAAVADALEAVALRKPGAADAAARLPRYRAQIAGRGACRHPDGALRFVGSAVDVFRDELALHLRGGCSADHADPVLPIPPTSSDWR